MAVPTAPHSGRIYHRNGNSLPFLLLSFLFLISSRVRMTSNVINNTVPPTPPPTAMLTELTCLPSLCAAILALVVAIAPADEVNGKYNISTFWFDVVWFCLLWLYLFSEYVAYSAIS